MAETDGKKENHSSDVQQIAIKSHDGGRPLEQLRRQYNILSFDITGKAWRIER